jgi:hypothetical protein
VATNFYFNNFTNSGEQRLIEDLIIESIRIFGIDAWYMKRNYGALDDLLNEDDLPTYNQAFLVEMYVKNVEGFEGDGDFLSKFGLQIRDSMTLTMSMRKFTEDVGLYNEEVRPLEGDLIYFPLNRKIFQIKHVEHEAIFYQMGSLQTYDFRVELYEYSNEVFNTGIEEIDTWLDKYKTTANNTIAGIESIDPIADNLTIETEADAILDFSESNPFGESNY